MTRMRGMGKMNKTSGDGYGKDGYNKSVWNRKGFHKDTGSFYDKDGYDIVGYNKDGYKRNGYNSVGWNSSGINRNTGTKYDRDGYRMDGFDKNDWDKYGYDRNGWNSERMNRTTHAEYDASGYDYFGYDKDGFKKGGFDKDGFNKKGLDKDGFDKDGFNKKGFDKDGFNKKGYCSTGYDRSGYNWTGYDINGFSKTGWSREGINRATGTQFDKCGFNKKGFDNEGIDKEVYEKRYLGEYANIIRSGNCSATVLSDMVKYGDEEIKKSVDNGYDLEELRKRRFHVVSRLIEEYLPEKSVTCLTLLRIEMNAIKKSRGIDKQKSEQKSSIEESIRGYRKEDRDDDRLGFEKKYLGDIATKKIRSGICTKNIIDAMLDHGDKEIEKSVSKGEDREYLIRQSNLAAEDLIKELPEKKIPHNLKRLRQSILHPEHRVSNYSSFLKKKMGTKNTEMEAEKEQPESELLLQTKFFLAENTVNTEGGAYGVLFLFTDRLIFMRTMMGVQQELFSIPLRDISSASASREPGLNGFLQVTAKYNNNVGLLKFTEGLSGIALFSPLAQTNPIFLQWADAVNSARSALREREASRRAEVEKVVDQPTQKNPMDILKERYVKGEITRDEYLQIKKDLAE